MGQMSFKKGKFFWIASAIIFIIMWAGSENFLAALFTTGILIGLLYLLFILLAKFFG